MKKLLSFHNDPKIKEKCLQWEGWTDKDGYGGVKIKGKNYRAHRVAKEIEIGRKLLASEVVMHLCNNHKCYNTKHLKVGTTAENNAHRRSSQKSAADIYLPGYKTIYG